MLPAVRGTKLWNDPLDLMRRDFGRLLDAWPEPGTTAATMGSYPVDIREDDESLYVEAEMPGFEKDQIDVTLENGLLTISAERTPTEFKGTRHLEERRYTRVHRQFTLPTSVDETEVDAQFKDGILHLALPKSAEAKPRRIRVM